MPFLFFLNIVLFEGAINNPSQNVPQRHTTTKVFASSGCHKAKILGLEMNQNLRKAGSTLTTSKIHGAEWEAKKTDVYPEKLSLGL